MPFTNEHAARLINPATLNPIRVRRSSGDGKTRVRGIIIPGTIDIIWYIESREGREIAIPQALRFPIKNWTEQQAKKWLADNKIKYITFEKASKE